MGVNRRSVSGRTGSPSSRSSKISPAEQRKRFAETARELGIPDTEAAQEKAFGKVGLRKPKKSKRKK